MKKQKDIFLKSEGNKWYQRNLKYRTCEKTIEDDLIIKIFKRLEICPKKILEIGCSNGYRLQGLKTIFQCECFGIDPSIEAITEGQKLFPGIKLHQGTADNIDSPNCYFDNVVLGFCLYLCDRKDLFKIAYEVDRVLIDTGYIIILDFNTPFPYKNKYKHYAGLYSYKMDYAKMFTWNPFYSCIFHQAFAHGYECGFDNLDDRIAVTVLQKNVCQGYPDNPF